MRETWVRSLGQEDPLQKEMATHSSILAWRIPWMEEPGRLQSMGSQRIGQDWETSLFLCIEQQASQSERIDMTHQRGKHTFLWSRIWAGNTSVNSRGDMCFCANTPSLFSLEDGNPGRQQSVVLKLPLLLEGIWASWGDILFLAWSRCADSESILLGRSQRAIKWLLVTSERHKGWLRPGPPAKDEAVVSKQIATSVSDDLSIMFKSTHSQHYSK